MTPEQIDGEIDADRLARTLTANMRRQGAPMTPEQTPTSNVDWEWYERGILEERKRQRAHIDTLTAALRWLQMAMEWEVFRDARPAAYSNEMRDIKERISAALGQHR